jgi:hypothetical protein
VDSVGAGSGGGGDATAAAVRLAQDAAMIRAADDAERSDEERCS